MWHCFSKKLKLICIGTEGFANELVDKVKKKYKNAFYMMLSEEINTNVTHKKRRHIVGHHDYFKVEFSFY